MEASTFAPTSLNEKMMAASLRMQPKPHSKLSAAARRLQLKGKRSTTERRGCRALVELWERVFLKKAATGREND